MLFGPNFVVKEALLLLISPGNTMIFGPCLAAFSYFTSVYMPLFAASLARSDTPLPAVAAGFDSLPQVGGPAKAACASPSPISQGAILTRWWRFISISLQCMSVFFWTYGGMSALRQ